MINSSPYLLPTWIDCKMFVCAKKEGVLNFVRRIFLYEASVVAWYPTTGIHVL